MDVDECIEVQSSKSNIENRVSREEALDTIISQEDIDLGTLVSLY
jgi:hypothetical protein